MFPTLLIFQDAINRHGITTYNCKAKLEQLMKNRADQRRRAPVPQLVATHITPTSTPGSLAAAGTR
jgi:hypothetical protein